MQIAHIILVHKNPYQVLRMVKALTHPDVDVWIHLDKKRVIEEYKAVFALRNVYIIEPRVKGEWGSFSLVQAMINGLKAAVASGKNYMYYNFLSGQDYPTQSPKLFYNYLASHSGIEFIGSRPYADTEENIRRIHKYYLNNYPFPGNAQAEKIINMLLPRRKAPCHFQITKGPQWMTLTSEAVHYLLKFIDEHPRFVRFFKFVHAPDEFFFQTILYNSQFRNSMREQVFHFTDWSAMGKSPAVLTIANKEQLERPDLFFARKFDTTVDKAILDYLDNKID
jgi:Core-2/I-Branching enzyme